MTAIILAGGKSSRFGTDKARAIVGGQPLIRFIAEKLRVRFNEIIVVSNQPENHGPLLGGLADKVVNDLIPGCGPLAGLHAGLYHSSSPVNFLVACDMPFASTSLARYLCARVAATGVQVVVPRSSAGLEPLHGAFSRLCLPALEAFLTTGNLSVQRFLEQAPTVEIGVEEVRRFGLPEQIFFNLNRPEDWRRAQDFLRMDVRDRVGGVVLRRNYIGRGSAGCLGKTT